MNIEISRLHFPVTALGPGKRIGIWFQGCSIRCASCISVDTWGTGRGATTVGQIVSSISPWMGEANGITISGGEPFDQPEALRMLVRDIRERTDADILLYSGYPFEQIQEHIRLMQGAVDALITDPYLFDAPQTLALRGSDNQRLHLLTELGHSRFVGYDRPTSEHDMALDLMFDSEGTVWMAGIPRRGDMERLVELLASQGHSAHTSQASTESHNRHHG